MSKPAPKETPPAERPAGTFDPVAVGDKIKEHLAEAGKAEVASETAQFAARAADARASQHTRAAAKLLLDVKTNHPEHMEAICKPIKLHRSRRFELLAIVEGRKTEAETKANTNKRVKNHRKKKEPAKAATGKPAKAQRASPSIQPGQESVTSPPVTDSAEVKDLRGHNRQADDRISPPDPSPQAIEIATATLQRALSAKSDAIRALARGSIARLHAAATEVSASERPAVVH